MPIDWRDGDVRLVLSSGRVAHSRLHPREKEPWTVAWLERCVRPGDVVWDVGANVGGYSLIAGALGAERVIAVEPDLANAAALAQNAALNGLGEVIVPLTVALDETERGAWLLAGEREPGATHRLALPGELAAGFVLSFPLDTLLARFAVPSPNLLKIDVDGHEAEVLIGAERALREGALRSVLVEVDERNTARVIGLLAAAGLDLVERHAPISATSGVWYGVFERRPSL